jgi:PEP-CTERM motif
MLRRFTSRLPAIVMAGLLILGLSERAHADLEITLSSGTGTDSASQANNGTLQFDLTNSHPGKPTFSTSGTAEGLTSTGTPASMDLSTITLSSNGAGTATIIFSENNISSPTGLGTISETISGHFLFGGSGSISYTTYGSNNNTLYNSLPLTPAPGGNSGAVTTLTNNGSSSSGSFNASAPYSLTEVLTITFNGTGTVQLSSDSSAQFTANAVPEPSSMAIAGLGALGMIGYGLRRRNALGA